MKYLIYQHGARGLGRISRTVKLVNILRKLDSTSTTIILSSDPIIREFPLPHDTEIASLPSMSKGVGKSYRADRLSLPLEELLELRGEVILGYARGFGPHYVVMDTFPGGVKGELRPSLSWVREHLPATKVVYVSRDILGPPDEIIPIWTQHGVYEVLENSVDRILIFGEKDIFDWAVEYRLSDRARGLLTYCGYFEHEIISRRDERDPSRRRILVTVGGGVDGSRIVRAALIAFRESLSELSLTVVLGPQMAEQERRECTQLGEDLAEVEIMTFTHSLSRLVELADVTISMGGFNTVNEILATRARAVLIPRKAPNKEQFERARRLQKLGLVSVIDPDELCPERLRSEVLALLAAPVPCKPVSLRFDTAARVGAALGLTK